MFDGLIPPSLVPAGVRDERQLALVEAFSDMLGEIDLANLIMSDPMKVDARLLPFMILEFGAQDFIAPDLPEDVQRRILSRIWRLKSLHGYDAGVKLGLELIGTKAAITHWYEMDPMGAPNTHRIEVDVETPLWPDDGGHFGNRQLTAIWRMIRATKRHSQDTELRLGVSATGNAHVGAFSEICVVATAGVHIAPPPVTEASSRVGVVPTVVIVAVAGRRDEPVPAARGETYVGAVSTVALVAEVTTDTCPGLPLTYGGQSLRHDGHPVSYFGKDYQCHHMQS